MVVVARYEVLCLLCGRVAVPSTWADDGGLRQAAGGRCGHCGGGLVAEYVGHFSRTPAAILADVPEGDGPWCPDCGVGLGPRNKSGRCRQDYLTWRYHHTPGVRERQLALQSRWRQRNGVRVRKDLM